MQPIGEVVRSAPRAFARVLQSLPVLWYGPFHLLKSQRATGLDTLNDIDHVIMGSRDQT